LEFLEKLAESGHRYNGFNLIVADMCKGQMAYLSNRKDPMKPEMVAPGFHVVCNGLLNTPWPKVGFRNPIQ
jgi:uncharacterized protein with NRDE domain